jgi:hypothetical protein
MDQNEDTRRTSRNLKTLWLKGQPVRMLWVQPIRMVLSAHLISIEIEQPWDKWIKTMSFLWQPSVGTPPSSGTLLCYFSVSIKFYKLLTRVVYNCHTLKLWDKDPRLRQSRWVTPRCELQSPRLICCLLSVCPELTSATMQIRTGEWKHWVAQ